jgi:hypothetical protein
MSFWSRAILIEGGFAKLASLFFDSLEDFINHRIEIFILNGEMVILHGKDSSLLKEEGHISTDGMNSFLISEFVDRFIV